MKYKTLLSIIAAGVAILLVLMFASNDVSLASALQTISIIIASCTAIYGIYSWQLETVGRKKIDLAEEVLSLFYEAEHRIRAIRSPLAFVGEGSTRTKLEDETENETKVFNRAYTSYERYYQYEESFNRLYAIRYRFMVHFGTDTGQHFDEIHRVLVSVTFSASMLRQLWVDLDGMRPGDTGYDERRKEVRRLEADIWQRSEGDEIGKKVRAAVEAIEVICKQAIEARIL
jgi:hypothetical protein